MLAKPAALEFVLLRPNNWFISGEHLKRAQQLRVYQPKYFCLHVDHCEGLTDSSISMLATRLGKKLKALELEWCQISQNCVRLIAENLVNLQVLNLSYCPSVNSEEI